ncbi:MAG: hypothetical protein GY800_09980 [Planctomycetes bacterium]|nr:hypothetical protein [Planctomycetota bacterium]
MAIATDLTVRDCEIANNVAQGIVARTRSNIRIEDNSQIVHNAGNGVYVLFNSVLLLKDSHIVNNYHGVHLSNNSRGVIRNTHITDNRGWGVSIENARGLVSITDSFINTNFLPGIYANKVTNLTLSKNQVNNNTSSGVVLINVNNASIKESNISDNRENGIFAIGPGKLTIEDNPDISLNDHRGISMKDNLTGSVTGNTVKDNKKGGIKIRNMPTRLELTKNEIIDNKGAATGGGILVWDNSNVVMTQNIIKKNKSNSSGGGIGVLNSTAVIGSRTRSERNIIEGNEALDGVGGGILVAGTSGVTIPGNVIKDNKAFTGPNSPGKGGGIGVLRGGSTVTITGNEIEDNKADNSGGGISMKLPSSGSVIGGRQSSDRNTIKDNKALDGNGGGMSIEGGDTEIRGNWIVDNTAESTRTGWGNGGGIAIRGGYNGLIAGNHIKNNTANEGGGIHADHSSPEIGDGGLAQVNIIKVNTANEQRPLGTPTSMRVGGGIYFEGATHSIVYRNSILGNKGTGIHLSGGDHNRIIKNHIGRETGGAKATNEGHGISLVESSDNTIGPGNVIAYNQGNGVSVGGGRSLRNTITKNTITNNAEMGIDNWSFGNREITPPILNQISSTVVTGSVKAPPRSIVEFFEDPDGEGERFLKQKSVAANGTFQLNRSFQNRGRNVTVTVRDPDGNTSEFSNIRLDLDGDGNHDGHVDNAVDDGLENTLPGVITLCNCDDDDKDGNKDNEGPEAGTIDNRPGHNDFDDLAPIILRQCRNIPPGWEVELTLHTPTNVAAGVGADSVVRIFADPRGPNATEILGPGTTTFPLPRDEPHDADMTQLSAGDINLAVEGLQFAGEVKLRVELRDNTGVVGSDEVQLKVSPLLLLGHLQAPTRSFVSQITLDPRSESAVYCTRRFPRARPGPAAAPGGVNDEIIPPALNGARDQWAQDEFQIGFQQAPYNEWHVVLDSKRDEDLNAFPGRSSNLAPPGLLGPEFGHIQISDGTPANSLDSFGNLEVSPPCRVSGIDYPFGRIYYGDGVPPGGRRMDANLSAFLNRQQVQAPVSLNSDWLLVGHVDEFMSIVPDPSGTHGWKVLIADSFLAVSVLAGLGKQPGVDFNLHIPQYTHFNFGTVVDRVGALLTRKLNTPVPAVPPAGLPGSARIMDYNINEVNNILFGPPGSLGGLYADIRTAFGLANTDFIRIPVLFNRMTALGLTGAEAITPDMVNSAVYGSVFIAPDNFLHNVGITEEDADSDFRLDPGEDRIQGGSLPNGLLDTLRDPFHTYTNGVLPPGITPRYIDDWEIYHVRSGEVHCSSNEVRNIPATRWWN